MAQSWERIGEVIASGDSVGYLELTSLPAREFLRIVVNYITTDTSGSKNITLQFNGDTGNTYSTLGSDEGATGTESNGTDSGNLAFDLDSDETGMLRSEIDITNYATKQKICSNKGASFKAGDYAPHRRQSVFKWTNSADLIDEVKVSISAGNLEDGSILTVYGADDASSTYPSLPNGTVFITSDTNVHYMWNGTDTWNEVA